MNIFQFNKINTLSDSELISVLSNNNDKHCMSILDLTRTVVHSLRTRFNVKNPHNQSLVARKFHFNQRYFEKIDTEQKAYILGFLAADGNVNPDKYGCEIRIVLHPKDTDLLEKINQEWESTYVVVDHHLGIYSGFPGSSKLQRKLSVRSRLMQTDLLKYGIIPNKTNSIRFPKLPDHLDRHFLRGFLEGDGYINHEAFGWTSNHLMCNDVQWIYIKHGFLELKKYKIKPLSSTVRGTPVHLDIIKWIYQDSKFHMNRKYEQYITYWKDRVYKKPQRPYYSNTKHIPCALEVLPPGQGSIP